MLQRPVPCENLISRLPCAHDGSAPHIAHAATPKVTLRPRNPRRVISVMTASFLSNVAGSMPGEAPRHARDVPRGGRRSASDRRVDKCAACLHSAKYRTGETTANVRARVPQQSSVRGRVHIAEARGGCRPALKARSEEHTSELQSPCNLVCRLLLEKKKKKQYYD